MGGPSDRTQDLGRAFQLLAGFVATSVVAGVLGAGLLMPAAGVTGSLARNSVSFFDSLPDEMQVGPLSQQSRILYADGSPMATFFYENRIAVPLGSVAPVMRQAVIAIEDSRFYEHRGADPKGIIRAMVNNASGGDTQGASTLTQQWVKNVLLDQAIQSGDEEMQAALRNPNKGRKLREIKLAVSAEKQLTKDEILQNYLNIALFGDGQYGVETASRHFLSKTSAELTLSDAALLAGMLQSPSRYDPIDNPQVALERRNVVLDRMLQLDMITQGEYDEAVAIPLEAHLNPQNTQNGCEQAGVSGFFCDYVTKVILTDPSFGADAEERKRLLYRGGLTITTTLNPAMQQAAYDEVNASVPPNEGSGVAAAITSVQPGTGHILAMAQNRGYNPRSESVPGTTSVNFSTPYAYGGSRGFQPGSTFKPIVLATWLKSGRSLNDVVPAGERRIPVRQFQRCDGRWGNDVWNVRNAGDGSGGGSMSVEEGTYRSVNGVYASMALQLNLCDIPATAASLGVTNPENGEPLELNPSMVLGGEEVAPIQMAGAFAAFGSQGQFCKPTAILSVTDPGGTALPVPSSDCNAALAPDVANGVTAALENTLIRGTARGLGIGRPAAGKTGTTNDSVATWFVGYTPQVSTAVWIGYPDASKSLNGSTIDGRRYGRMYGGTLAAPIWNRYMTRAHEGLPVTGFAAPSEKVRFGDRSAVPKVAGQSLDQAQATLQEAGFTAQVGGGTSSDVDRGLAAGTEPRAGARVAPGSTVTILVSSGREQPRPAPPTEGEGPPGPGNGEAPPGWPPDLPWPPGGGRGPGDD